MQMIYLLHHNTHAYMILCVCFCERFLWLACVLIKLSMNLVITENYWKLLDNGWNVSDMTWFCADLMWPIFMLTHPVFSPDLIFCWCELTWFPSDVTSISRDQPGRQWFLWLCPRHHQSGRCPGHHPHPCHWPAGAPHVQKPRPAWDDALCIVSGACRQRTRHSGSRPWGNCHFYFVLAARSTGTYQSV